MALCTPPFRSAAWIPAEWRNFGILEFLGGSYLTVEKLKLLSPSIYKSPLIIISIYQFFLIIRTCIIFKSYIDRRFRKLFILYQDLNNTIYYNKKLPSMIIAIIWNKVMMDQITIIILSTLIIQKNIDFDWKCFLHRLVYSLNCLTLSSHSHFRKVYRKYSSITR